MTMVEDGGFAPLSLMEQEQLRRIDISVTNKKAPVSMDPVIIAGPIPSMHSYLTWNEPDGWVIFRVGNGSFHLFKPSGVHMGAYSLLSDAQHQGDLYRKGQRPEQVKDQWEATFIPKSEPEDPPEAPEQYGGW